MDGAMKRGQALIDPGGREVWVLKVKREEEGCTVCNGFIQPAFSHVYVLTWKQLKDNRMKAKPSWIQQGDL